MGEHFERELKNLINSNGLEGFSDTPDVVLAQFLNKCLEAFDGAVNHRTKLCSLSQYKKELECLTPSEALYGFAAWITTRKEQVAASSKDDAGVWARLVDEFCKTNNLAEPRDTQPDFTMPPKE